jgi:endonuclease-3
MSEITSKALTIHKLLLEEYGPRTWRPPDDPLDTLISVILSQNTTDVNRDRAFERLRQRFPTWEAVRDAEVAAIAGAIRPAGLARTKAPRIKEALQTISRERDELSLAFLADMSVEEARAWLISLNGIGPKSAAIVLCFAFGRPAFPVDTHVHRVSKRLGLIGSRVSREKAHTLLEELLPSAIYYTFHLNLIAHGRQVCKARQPHCATCILQKQCDYFNYSAQNGKGFQLDSKM